MLALLLAAILTAPNPSATAADAAELEATMAAHDAAMARLAAGIVEQANYSLPRPKWAFAAMGKVQP